MRPAARGFGGDRVLSLTGLGRQCRSPMATVTGTGSATVFINGFGAVRFGDLVGPHPRVLCAPDVSPMTGGSTSVFINGMPAGRIGDRYTLDNIIISGSTNVFIG